MSTMSSSMHGSMDFETPNPTRSFELPGSDIQREGILKKLKTNKKKYFVLRSTSSSGPARLEYYDSEKKLRAGLPPKRSVILHTCFNINKKNDSRQKYAIALYTKDECFSVVADDAVEQELWLNLLLKLQNEFIPPGEMPKRHFDHVWQVSVKPKGLGMIRGICGDYRLCLSDSDICMVKRNSDKPEHTFQLSSIRRYANTDNFFFMEVGRHSPTGPGELYMQLEDSFSAQNIHEELLVYMRKNSGADIFRQRSSTSTSTLRRSRESGESESDVTIRQRTHSESKKNTGSPRRSIQRPQSVATLPRSPENNIMMNSGFYANIPSTFNVPRDRSDSSSSRASSHKSLPPEGYGSSPEPIYENTKDNSNTSSLRSMTPESFSIPITEESLSTYMDMSPSQNSVAIMENTPYLDMMPGQQPTNKQLFISPIQPIHGRSSSLPVTQSSNKSDTDKAYMAMSPGQSTQETVMSSYMAMSPGQHSGPMTNSQGQQQSPVISSPGTPYSPPSQRVSRPETPPSQRVSRPGSSCSHDSSINSSDGYMEMNPAEQSKSSEKVNNGPEQGYIDMTVGSSSSTSSKDGSPKLSRTAPIPIRSTKQSAYMDMGPSSQPLAPVKEGGSGEGNFPLTQQHNHFVDMNLRPNKVVSYLSDDSMSGEFPKRAYSVGSRPPRKLLPQHLHHPVMPKQNVSTNGRSSSAPHLIEKKLRNMNMIPYTTMDSSLSCSPSQSIKSSISDSDSFIEMEHMRPRTSSDSFGCRPRSSSFGKVFVQGHRPRSSSYGTSARGKLGSYESVRLTSKELHIKRSNESLTGQISGASSSESLKRNDSMSKSNKKSEYVDMRLDKSEAPGYIDMTVNPKSVGNKSSTSSLSSSPAVVGLTSPIRQDATSSPSIKIIKPSGNQKSIGFSTSTNSSSTDNIPPPSSLFSPINFVSPSGSRSPSVKGRSPASSGRESEEESYMSYQPASAEKTKDEKKSENKKEKKSWHSKSKHKDKKQSEEKEKKNGSKVSVASNNSSGTGLNIQEMKNDRDSMYMDYEPGALNVSTSDSTNPVQFSCGNELNLTSSGSEPSMDTSQNQTMADSSPYMEYEPESVAMKSDMICSENIVSDDSAYMEYEPGSAEQSMRTSEPDLPPAALSGLSGQKAPPIPPRKTEGAKFEQEETFASEYESGGSSIETLKDSGSACHVDLDPYMDFDPENSDIKPGVIKAPSRVRSFITDTSMEEELGKDNSVKEVSGTVVPSSPIDKPVKQKASDSVQSEKSVQIKTVINPNLSETIPESDEYVGLEFKSKSTERFLLGGITPGNQNITSDQLISSKNSKKDNLFKNEVGKPDNRNEKKLDIKIKNLPDVFEGSVSSLEELKIVESPTEKDIKECKSRHSSTSSKISTSPLELSNKSSLLGMNLPVESLELHIKEKVEKVEIQNSANSNTSRHSCSDLTMSYEPMNFPSDTLKNSELSSSQQQLTTPGLNYASLDLGSRENIDNDIKLQPVKSRHASTAEDSGPLPPNSYAQIDFNMSENLKNSGKQDGKFSKE
ncbi:insulin receptor substrate 1-B-like [Mytilus edulis]|uniref:insulin receptor substrate 1-B-like n=1 Tax=Mytilus edulis TaxID=6550 RepID=UPI0039EE01D1